MILAERLRIARERKELTQRELAERAGVHFTYVSKLESGKQDASREVLEKLAYELTTSAAWLSGKDDTDTQRPQDLRAEIVTQEDMAMLTRYRKLDPEHKSLILAMLNAIK